MNDNVKRIDTIRSSVKAALPSNDNTEAFADLESTGAIGTLQGELQNDTVGDDTSAIAKFVTGGNFDLEGIDGGSMAMSVSSVGNAMSADLESFDANAPADIIANSVALNSVAIDSDGITALFPSIQVDMSQGVYELVEKSPRFMNTYSRGTGATSAAAAKVIIAEGYKDTSLFTGGNKRKLVPVLRTTTTGSVTKNDELFLTAAQYNALAADGTTILTAPLLLGKDVPLIDVSQTDVELAGGYKTNEDTLSTDAGLGDVVVSSTFDTGAGDVTEYYKLKAANTAGAVFNVTQEGGTRDIVLTYDNVLTLNLDNVDDQVIGANTIFTTGGYSVDFNVKLSGQGNLDTGVISINKINDLTVAAIRSNTTGEVVTSGAAFDTVTSKLAVIGLAGYIPEANSSNTNLRDIGVIIEDIQTSTRYPVPYRTPVSVLASKVTGQGVSDKLDTLNIVSRGQKEADAVITLINFINIIKGTVSTDSPLSSTKFKAAGTAFIKPAYSARTIALETEISSITSGNRREDITAYITDVISTMASELVQVSQYNIAHKLLTGKSKVKLAITTSEKVAAYIDAAAITAFDVTIGVSTFSEFTNRIVFSFMPNDNVPLLNFGIRPEALDIVVPLTKQVSGSNADCLVVVPRYVNAISSPILGDITLTGLEESFNKTAIDFNSI